ncbi:MAG: CNNM domain-containing protein [Phycisphaerae bacterium]
MGPVAYLILYALLAVAVSFLCSLLEACLLSLPRSFVESLVDQGHASGRALRRMKDDIDRPLAAILSLNTIANTAGAAGVGAQATIVFGSASLGIVSAVLTLLILVVSEIIPKTLGAVHAKALAGPAAVLIRGMVWLTLPLVIPLEWINRLISRDRRQAGLSRSELSATIRLSQASGAMAGREYQIASNLLALSRMRLIEVMTPRTVVFSLPEGMSVGEVLREHHPIPFARIPIYAGNHEQVTAYVPRVQIQAAWYDGKAETKLKDLARPILILPDMATVGDALESFIRRKQHIALAVDEYGGKSGIVTLEDILETLLGDEIVDETDRVTDMQQLARHRAQNGD